MASLQVDATAAAVTKYLNEHGYTYLNEDKIPHSLCCPVDRRVSVTRPAELTAGSEPLVDPITLRCSHMMSKASAEKLARHAKEHGKDLRCPTCRARFDPARVQRAVPFVLESLDGLQVRCIAAPACDWSGDRGELAAHFVTRCPEAIVRCSCGHIGRRAAEHPAWCPRLEIECPSPRCGEKVARADLHQHIKGCAGAGNVRAGCASRLCSFAGSYAVVYKHQKTCGFLGPRPIPIFPRSTRRISSAT